MKIDFFSRKAGIITAILALNVLTSCNKDDDPVKEEETNLGYALALVSGSGETQTTFLQGLQDLNVSTVNNNNSTELPQYASIFSDGESLFTPGFGAPATMGKYKFNEERQIELDQQIVVQGSNTFSTVELVNETEAYATVGGGVSRIIKFDPTEMKITGEIDLSSAGTGIFYADIITTESKIFIALNDFGGSGIAKVAVVDRTSGLLEKVITDERTTTLLGSTNTTVFALDANGDIYVHGSGLFSEFSEGGKKASGILRIKNGETEFDPDYFFNLTEATGFTTCYGLYHFGDGLTFTTISENDDNFFGSDGASPSFRYYRIDLDDQSSKGDLGTAIPNTFAASRSMFMTKIGDKEILFPIAGVDEDALYSYEISTGEITKKIVSEGGFISGLVSLK